VLLREAVNPKNINGHSHTKIAENIRDNLRSDVRNLVTRIAMRTKQRIRLVNCYCNGICSRVNLNRRSYRGIRVLLFQFSGAVRANCLPVKFEAKIAVTA
jgi:hypothetical protein